MENCCWNEHHCNNTDSSLFSCLLFLHENYGSTSFAANDWMSLVPGSQKSAIVSFCRANLKFYNHCNKEALSRCSHGNKPSFTSGLPTFLNMEQVRKNYSNHEKFQVSTFELHVFFWVRGKFSKANNLDTFLQSLAEILANSTNLAGSAQNAFCSGDSNFIDEMLSNATLGIAAIGSGGTPDKICNMTRFRSLLNTTVVHLSEVIRSQDARSFCRFESYYDWIQTW